MKFLRNLVLSLILFSIVGSTLMVPLIYVDFEVRRDYISKVLCVERNKPITVCKGSCYLTSRLEKAMEHEQEQKSLQPVQEIHFFLSESSSLLANIELPVLENYFILVDEALAGQQTIFGIFHPPQS